MILTAKSSKTSNRKKYCLKSFWAHKAHFVHADRSMGLFGCVLLKVVPDKNDFKKSDFRKKHIYNMLISPSKKCVFKDLKELLINLFLFDP